MIPLPVSFPMPPPFAPAVLPLTVLSMSVSVLDNRALWMPPQQPEGAVLALTVLLVSVTVPAMLLMPPPLALAALLLTVLLMSSKDSKLRMPPPFPRVEGEWQKTRRLSAPTAVPSYRIGWGKIGLPAC